LKDGPSQLFWVVGSEDVEVRPQSVDRLIAPIEVGELKKVPIRQIRLGDQN